MGETASDQVQGDEAHGLDDLIDQEQVNEEQQEHEDQQELINADQPTSDEVERAKQMAAMINDKFLVGVNFVCCPSVAIDQIADREKGNEAFFPLALKHGGEVPPWLLTLYKDWMPYIGAAYYMGKTIAVARKVEAAIQEQAEEEHKKQQGDNDGEE